MHPSIRRKTVDSVNSPLVVKKVNFVVKNSSIMSPKSARLLIKLLTLQIVVVHSIHVPLSSTEPSTSARLLDYKTSKKLKKFLNEVKGKFGWIYNATVPHGYGDAVASYDVPVYNKFGSNGKPTLAGYTKDYIVEPDDDSNEELKTIEAAELSMFEKFERFKNNVDLLFMTKVILKILVFKKIIKFIGLVCLLFFLPTINDNSDDTSRNLKHRGNSTSKWQIKDFSLPMTEMENGINLMNK